MNCLQLRPFERHDLPLVEPLGHRMPPSPTGRALSTTCGSKILRPARIVR